MISQFYHGAIFLSWCVYLSFSAELPLSHRLRNGDLESHCIGLFMINGVHKVRHRQACNYPRIVYKRFNRYLITTEHVGNAEASWPCLQ